VRIDYFTRRSKAARRRLCPFGWFSHLRRLLRFWIKGYYYTGEEFILVTTLDAAVLRFVTAFKVQGGVDRHEHPSSI
jgi:hypothetical protein